MINYIDIQNFKSIKKTSSNLPVVGAFVGKNAAGKTNIFQAINFVKSLITGETIVNIYKKIALTPQEIFHYNESSKDLSFAFVVSNIQGKKYRYEITITSSNGSVNLPILIVKNESLYQVSSNDELQTIYKRDMSILTDKDGKNIPLAVDVDKTAASLYQYPDVLSLKSIFTNISITDQNSIDSRESIVNPSQNGLASLLVRLIHSNSSRYMEFQTIIGKVLPLFSSFIEKPASQTGDTIVEEKDKYYMILLEEKNLNGKLSMKSVSAGDLRTLYIIASALSLEDGSSLFIEEIENGLHPKRLRDLLEYLDNISRIKNLQIIYTTHSPSVIDRLRPSEVMYVEKNDDMGTSFYLLSESKHVTHIQNILDKGLSMTDYLSTKL